ncbi:MAG TPA: hypothetical protein VM680_20020 [Verrucomicrobiae bacterium]|nr:hypothetical protein [Verrucomicrobiae bacterium]
MSAPENPNPSSDAQTIAELRSAVDSLRGVFQVVALSGIVLSCTIFLFFFRETKSIRRQNDEFRVVINEFDTNVLPKIEMARTNLEAFARTNPTFVPIYKKYFPTNAPDTKTAAPKP